MESNVIVVSGPPGSGNSTIGRLIAKKLNIDFFSPGQFFKDISRGRVKENPFYPLFEELCENKGLVLEEFTSSSDSNAAIATWDSKLGKDKRFHEAIDSMQIALAEEGDIVLDGKLSLRMIKNPTLKIWLNCSLNERAKRVSKRDKVDIATAKSLLVKKEKIEREEWKKIYGFDYFDQEKEADLVIDTSYLTPKKIVGKILSKLNNKL